MLTRANEWIRRREVLYFLTLSGCFFAIGLVIGGLGPIVLELARRTRIDVESVGWFVSCRGIGYVTGNIAGGSLVDFGIDTSLILAVSITMCALSLCLVTISYNFWLVLFLLFVQGLSMGTLDSCGNMSLILSFRDHNVAPYFQFLHFCFAVGSTVSPLVIGVVMDNFHSSFNIGYYALAAVFIPLIFLMFIQSSPEQETHDVTKLPDDAPIDENYRCGLANFTFSLGDWFVVVLTSLFLCFYVGAEVGTGSLIYTYVVKKELGPDFTGYMMTMVFWGCLAFGRLTAIPLSIYFSGLTMLLANLIGCLGSTIFILIFVNNVNALWVGIAFYGYFMASNFPTAFVVAEGMMRVTGSAVSLFVIGSGIGEVVVPLITSELFGTSLSYNALIYTMIASTLIGLLCWSGLLFRSRYIKVKAEEAPIICTTTDGEELDVNEGTALTNKDRD